jgi:predicted restriction endonuclease
MACETQILVSLSPRRYYAEAAHIRPLGTPHNGPDAPSNMIVLCPNHHLQFDRGVISIEFKAGVPTFMSQILGDPIHGKPIGLHPKHTITVSHVEWHRAYFRKIPRR